MYLSEEEADKVCEYVCALVKEGGVGDDITIGRIVEIARGQTPSTQSEARQLAALALMNIGHGQWMSRKLERLEAALEGQDDRE